MFFSDRIQGDLKVSCQIGALLHSVYVCVMEGVSSRRGEVGMGVGKEGASFLVLKHHLKAM